MTFLKDFLIKKEYKVSELLWNEEREVYEMMASITDDIQTNAIKQIKIGMGLVYSADYQKSLITGRKIFKFDHPPFVVINGDKENTSVVLKDKRRLLLFLMEEGQKGLSIQRYKGLGEMNPGQLWETTMNPGKRTLLKVHIEDVVETDEIFTILMGDEVEPRREFIQDNALDVRTLDI